MTLYFQNNDPFPSTPLFIMIPYNHRTPSYSAPSLLLTPSIMILYNRGTFLPWPLSSFVPYFHDTLLQWTLLAMNNVHHDSILTWHLPTMTPSYNGPFPRWPLRSRFLTSTMAYSYHEPFPTRSLTATNYYTPSWPPRTMAMILPRYPTKNDSFLSWAHPWMTLP